MDLFKNILNWKRKKNNLVYDKNWTSFKNIKRAYFIENTNLSNNKSEDSITGKKFHYDQKFQKTQNYFGRGLEFICKIEQNRVPSLVVHCAQIIFKYGLHSEGIFRINGNMRKVEEIKNHINLKWREESMFDLLSQYFKLSHKNAFKVNNSETIDPSQNDANNAVALLKSFLRQLPNPIIGEPNTSEFLYCLSIKKVCGNKVNTRLKSLVDKLPQKNRDLLKFIMQLLVLVNRWSVVNKMSACSLGIVMGPNIFRIGMRQQQQANSIVAMLIEGYDDIFKESFETFGSKFGNLKDPNRDFYEELEETEKLVSLRDHLDFFYGNFNGKFDIYGANVPNRNSSNVLVEKINHNNNRKDLIYKTLNDEISKTIASFLFPADKSYSEDSLTKLSVESFDEKMMSPTSELDPSSEFNDTLSLKYEKLKEIEIFKNQIHDEKILINDSFERNYHKQLSDFENDIPPKTNDNIASPMKKELKSKTKIKSEKEESMMFDRSKKAHDKGPQTLIAQQSFTKLQMMHSLEEGTQNFPNNLTSESFDNRGVENERSGEMASQKSSWSRFSDEFDEVKEDKTTKSVHNTNVLKRFDKKVVKNPKVSPQKEIKWAKTSKCLSHIQTEPQKTTNIKDDNNFSTKKSCEPDVNLCMDDFQQSKSDNTLKIRTIPIDRYTGDIPKTFIASQNLNKTKKIKNTTDTHGVNNDLKSSENGIENFGDGGNSGNKKSSFATFNNNFVDKVCYESLKEKESIMEVGNKDKKTDNEVDHKARNIENSVREEEQGTKKFKIDTKIIDEDKKQEKSIHENSKIDDKTCSNDKITVENSKNSKTKLCNQLDDTSNSSSNLKELLSVLKNAEKEHDKTKVDNSASSFETKLKFVDSMKINLMRKRIAEGRPANTRKMTSQQLNVEKTDLQKMLLCYERIFGKAVVQEEKELVRPFYNRYSNVKQMIKSVSPH